LGCDDAYARPCGQGRRSLRLAPIAFPHAAWLQTDFEAAIQRAARKRQPEEKEASVVDALVAVVEDEAAGGAADADGSVVVFTSIGNDTTSEGKRVEKEFEKSVGCRLPLPIAPDLAAVRTRLTSELPWAVSIADEMLKGLVGRDHVTFRPTILLGPPGCGKKVFATLDRGTRRSLLTGLLRRLERQRDRGGTAPLVIRGAEPRRHGRAPPRKCRTRDHPRRDREGQ